MQLHKLCKHASELEWSGGGRGRAEVEGVRGSQRWVEKGKGGCAMTSMKGLAILLKRWHSVEKEWKLTPINGGIESKSEGKDS